jgi:hypothetical protein
MQPSPIQFLDLYRSMTIELWRASYRAVGEAQVAFMAQVQDQVGQATETVRQTYDLTRKATDDAARIASQVSEAVTHAGENAFERASSNGSGSHARRGNGAGSHKSRTSRRRKRA